MDLHDEGDLFEFAAMLAFRTPEIIAAILGMIIALANWSRYPRPALFSFLGFGLLLILVVATEVFFFFFIDRVFGVGMDFLLMDNLVHGVRSTLTAAAYGLLMAAVFVSRKPQVPPPRYP